MRRWPIMAAVLLLLAILPSRGTEIGKLHPVKLLYVFSENGSVAVTTDTGDIGSGNDAEEALTDLENTTAGYIFLDTVEMLVITGQTESELPHLTKVLRPSVQVCCGMNGMDPCAVAQYLEAHPSKRKLLELQNGEVIIPELLLEAGRYRFAQNVDRTG